MLMQVNWLLTRQFTGGKHSSRGGAVAMLVFLAGAARAGLVAADLPMDGPRLRRLADKRFDGFRAGGAETRLGGLRAKGARAREAGIDRATWRGQRIGIGNLESIHRRRPFEGDLDTAQLRRRRLPQLFDQFAEKLEGLR